MWQDGRTCFGKYGEILALEFESPAVFGAVHHITVNCYNIQHPDEFTTEAQEWMLSALRDVIEKGLTPAELLERARKSSGQCLKMRRETVSATPVRRIPWSMTVLHIRTDSPEVYTGDIMAWAKSILNDLDIARSTGNDL
jgi:hypothetical protein